jgi:hypothetical protein
MLLEDSGELNRRNFFKDIAKTASKTAKSVRKETKKLLKW